MLVSFVKKADLNFNFHFLQCVQLRFKTKYSKRLNIFIFVQINDLLTMIKFHSAVIFVKDIELSKAFYTEILDEEIEHDFGKNVALKSGLSLWELRPQHIIATKLDITSKGNKIELYFESEEIDQIAMKLRENNVQFFHEIHEEPWGQRTIRFFDPDNHLVEIGEPLPVFIKNMYKKGMSVEEIEKKSGVPRNTIKEYIK
jgi:catechol 2,3-dioxygenase-like lactoylglutathione lyase family enzyme